MFPERSVTGSVAYQVLDRWPGACALRLTYYFSKHARAVLIPYDALPGADRGTLAFSVPALGDPAEVVPGPDAVFVEIVTLDAGGPVVEGNAAVAAVRVMPPGAESR